MTLRAACTWGEAEDVMLVNDGALYCLYEAPIMLDKYTHGCSNKGSFSMTADEAEALAMSLMLAAQQARQLEAQCNAHLEYLTDFPSWKTMVQVYGDADTKYAVPKILLFEDITACLLFKVPDATNQYRNAMMRSLETAKYNADLKRWCVRVEVITGIQPVVEATLYGVGRNPDNDYHDEDIIHKCTCTPDCIACKGQCGCKACHMSYSDFLSGE